MKNKPQYAIESVDHALRLALLLQQEAPLRVSDAAERLGVARSTAHRLLAMLVYRDFADQTDDRRYTAGVVLRSGLPPASHASHLRAVALPHLEALMERTGETVNLQVLVGDQARFVGTVECHQVLRVGDREGRMLPAHLVSGGKVLLAAMPEEAVQRLYSGQATHSGPVDVSALLAELRLVRRRGFAVNDQQTETGVTAVARLLRSPDGAPHAGISLAMPSARFSSAKLAHWLEALEATVTHIEHDLATDVET